MCCLAEIRTAVGMAVKAVSGPLSKSCWSLTMAACLLDSLLLMTIAQRAALVSHLRIASVNLPLPL